MHIPLAPLCNAMLHTIFWKIFELIKKEENRTYIESHDLQKDICTKFLHGKNSNTKKYFEPMSLRSIISN
jgi:hypothetical protein